MADNRNTNEDIGKYARHPRRTAGTAFLMGTAIGAAFMAMKQKREKSFFDKIIDRFDK